MKRKVAAPVISILALLTAGGLLLFSSDGEDCTGPKWSMDHVGRPQRWAQSSIQLDVALPRGASEEEIELIRATVERATGTWRVNGIPRIKRSFRSSPAVLNEDGENMLAFDKQRKSCASRGRLCLPDKLRGVTKIYSVPDGPDQARIVEADVVVDRALLKDEEALSQTLVHELGHVLGLDHPGPDEPTTCTVMTSESWKQQHPTPLDLSTLAEAYRRRRIGR